jgi:hypothetical protein
MNRLNPITTLEQLSTMVPKLVAMHSKLESKWAPGMSREEFLEELVRRFQNDCWYFGDLDETGDIKYFAIIRDSKQNAEAFFHLFYMNPKYRTETKLVTDLLKSFMRNQGFTSCFLSTTRLTSAYNRWLAKQGAEPYSMIYKLDLSQQ